MTKRPRPFTAENRFAEHSGSFRTITNDDLLKAFNDLSDTVEELTGRIIAKLESPAEPPAPPQAGPGLERISQEVAALKAARPEEEEIPLARQELEIVVEATDTAANEIMTLSEEIQAAADKIRDETANGNPAAVERHCAALDQVSANLMMACGFQDLTGQRINKVVNTLHHLESQIDGLFQTLGVTEATGEGGLHAFAPDDKRPDTELLHGPQNEGEGISQADIDAMFD